MRNKEIAKILYEISYYLKTGEIDFKPYVYNRAAIGVEGLEEDIENTYKKGGIKALENVPGVGKSIAEKIEEYLKTGKIKYYEDLKKKMPFNMAELIAVEGLGPKKAKILWQKLGVKNLRTLEIMARNGKIRNLPGFGLKTEKNILEGIAFLKRDRGRFLLGEIMPIVNEVLEKLNKLKWAEKVSPAGSVRRMKETIGDVDILVVSKDPKKVMDFFVSLPGVAKVWGKGATKASLRMRDGFDMDLRVVPERSYGSALQYFTGSKEHNIATRSIAIEKGLKLNEYGVFRGAKLIAGKTEEDVYRAIGLPFIPPEIREDQGEIEAAINGKLPEIIDQKDIKGDLHCHSDWDGGTNSIEKIAKAAMDMGYEYVGIADHTKFLKIERGLDEKKLERRNKEIDKLNSKLEAQGLNFKVLKGCEANILNDGSLDIENETLKNLDFVIAGVHSSFKMQKGEMTARLIKAMQNPNVDIISHPTGRIIQHRDEYQIDFDRILKVAKETRTVLEINSYPERLDLKDSNIKKAKEAGVKMAVNTDTHEISQLNFMKYGISQARRGWAEKKDIINAWPLKELLDSLKK
jgi:DNA polymerase (family 10)